MKLKERVLRRLNGQDVDMTPTGSTTAYACVEFMKRCGHCRPLADTDPAVMAGLALAGHTIGGFEWIKAMGWDITSLSEAMGCELGPPTMESTMYVSSHPFEGKDIGELECPPDLLQRGRFPIYKEQFRILKEQCGDELAIFGMSEGPFTCAANLMGTSATMRATLKDPARIEKAMDVTTEAAIKVINFAFSQGADYYCIAEPTSAPDLLSPRSWKRFVGPYLQRLAKSVSGPIVLHICGNTDILIEDMCDTGVAGISIEEKADLGKAIEAAHAKGVKVFGNVSSSSTLFMGTPEACKAEALAALEKGVDFLAPGCGIAPVSPLENILQLRHTRDEYFGAPAFVPIP